MFADDLKLYMPIHSRLNDCHKLEHELDRFYLRCSTNGFSINAEKYDIKSLFQVVILI